MGRGGSVGVASAKAVNWASELFGNEEQFDGDAHSEAHSTIRNDGTVRTGTKRMESLRLTGWDKATGTITGESVIVLTLNKDDDVDMFRRDDENLGSLDGSRGMKG